MRSEPEEPRREDERPGIGGEPAASPAAPMTPDAEPHAAESDARAIEGELPNADAVPGPLPSERPGPDTPVDSLPDRPTARELTAPFRPRASEMRAPEIRVPDVGEEEEPTPIPPVVEVEELDWDAVRRAADPRAVEARLRPAVERLETLLDAQLQPGGPSFLFDEHRATPDDKAIVVADLDPAPPLWFVGDLHGDLLALEAALALARRSSNRARLVFLGDLFDDGAYGLAVLIRVFELLAESPDDVCVICGNHDESLGWNGERFTATVSPSDFSELLNEYLDDETVVRAGKLAIRLFANAPRALFLPDGLLVVHGGFPLADLHAELRDGADWNAPRCLTDFVWVRAHPKARKKMPNRSTRGSQFGYEDFDAFCALSAELGRPVTHMVRGHDHEEARWAVYPAYRRHPVLTTVALSRRLPREIFGAYVRVPTVARWVPGALPQVHRLHVPEPLVRELYPEEVDDAGTTDSDIDLLGGSTPG